MDRQEKWELTKDILKAVGLAGALVMVAVAPGTAILLKSIARDEYGPPYKPYRINQAVKRLERRGFVSIQNRGDKKIISLAPKGIEFTKKLRLEELKIGKPKKWDNKWRVIVFDVQEKNRKTRNQLRRALIHVGFKKLQESVWIFPYPCDKAVDLIKDAFHLENDILHLTTLRFAGDQPLLKSFNI